jgi:hypothetical protein
MHPTIPPPIPLDRGDSPEHVGDLAVVVRGLVGAGHPRKSRSRVARLPCTGLPYT